MKLFFRPREAATLATLLLALPAGHGALAADVPTDATALARMMSERAANVGQIATMQFTLTSSRGKTRERTARMYQKEDTAMDLLAIHFTAPAAIEGSAFLSHDRHDPAAGDETWLYLPSTERVRRLPASDEGDAFMGTDFSYGDIRDDFKFDLADYAFSGFGETETEAGPRYTLAGRTVSPEVAAETGYGSFAALVDPNTLFPVDIEFSDTNGKPVKRIRVLEQTEVDGVWIATHFDGRNLVNDHHTDVKISDISSVPDLNAEVFRADRLDFGLPDVD